MTNDQIRIYQATGMMRHKDILKEVAAERVLQDEMWGGPKHDDSLSPEDWGSLISERIQFVRLGWCGENLDTVRKQLIQIGALAVAAVDAIDRREKEVLV